MEPYTFSTDGSKVLFACDALVGRSFDATTICEMNSDLTGTPTKISPATPTGFWANYNEFAYYMPNSNKIIFARTTGAVNGLDYWTIDRTGQNAQQLTHQSDSTHKAICGGLAFDPQNPKRFCFGYAIDNTDGYKSAMIEID